MSIASSEIFPSWSLITLLYVSTTTFCESQDSGAQVPEEESKPTSGIRRSEHESSLSTFQADKLLSRKSALVLVQGWGVKQPRRAFAHDRLFPSSTKKLHLQHFTTSLSA